MAVVVLRAADGVVALREELVVVEVPGVARDAEVVAAVLRAQHLLAGHEGLVELLAVARADDPDLGLAVFRVNPRIHLLEGLRQHIEGGGGSLLDEEVPVAAVLEGVHHEIDGVVERHHEPGHVRVGYGYRLALHHLLHPEGNHRAAAGHHVAVARAADGRPRIRAERTPLGDGHLLHHRLGDAHRVYRVRRLVGREDDDVPHAVGYCRKEDVVRALHVRADGLHGIELAGRNLLEGRGREDVVNPVHREVDRLAAADVPDVELDLPRDLGTVRL